MKEVCHARDSRNWLIRVKSSALVTGFVLAEGTHQMKIDRAVQCMCHLAGASAWCVDSLVNLGEMDDIVLKCVFEQAGPIELQ